MEPTSEPFEEYLLHIQGTECPFAAPSSALLANPRQPQPLPLLFRPFFQPFFPT